ncbi:hypothetical protein B7P43_G08152 [Cryptotermes secundus]|uniref:Uncharacterized protein n=1 Tax=Cryptotermes secundus TaxID=105785 RepID=A0A2J7QA51_9NEOP|nr:hypothetical protein B7P43_G08152 [Cryptotermes secundus]
MPTASVSSASTFVSSSLAGIPFMSTSVSPASESFLSALLSFNLTSISTLETSADNFVRLVTDTSLPSHSSAFSEHTFGDSFSTSGAPTVFDSGAEDSVLQTSESSGSSSTFSDSFVSLSSTAIVLSSVL